MAYESKENNPIMTAKEMTAALNENTEAMNTLNNRTRNVVFAFLIVLLVFCYSIKSKHDNDVNTCRKGNELRAQIDSKFDSIQNFIRSNTPPERLTQSTKDLLDLLNEDLTARNCGNIRWG